MYSSIILNLRNMLFIDTYDHFQTDYSSNFWLHSFDFPLPPLDMMNHIDFLELNDILTLSTLSMMLLTKLTRFETATSSH